MFIIKFRQGGDSAKYFSANCFSAKFFRLNFFGRSIFRLRYYSAYAYSAKINSAKVSRKHPKISQISLKSRKGFSAKNLQKIKKIV